MSKTYGFETLSIHAGAGPDPATGARALPIYQTTAYAFDDADHAAALFNLQTVGFIYSRLTNPTNAALETRLATLESYMANVKGVKDLGRAEGPEPGFYTVGVKSCLPTMSEAEEYYRHSVVEHADWNAATRP